LPKSKRELNVGPVRIIRSEDLFADLEAFKAEPKRDLRDIEILFDDVRHKLSYKFSSGQEYDIPPSLFMWSVTANVSKKNLREEALWLVNVAMTLLRVSSGRWNSFTPSLSDREPLPVYADPYLGKSELKKSSSNYLLGGGKIDGFYEITTKVFNDLSKDDIQSKIDQVFDHNPNTIAEQVYYAAGWLSKGRQALDRSERHLNFFTAIETLLTRQSSNSPVIDTIARHGSVLLARTPTNRPIVFTAFKRLYGNRSQTVHRGYRKTVGTEAQEAHYLAELLIRRILDKCDLSQSHDSLCNALSDASFGDKWP